MHTKLPLVAAALAAAASLFGSPPPVLAGGATGGGVAFSGSVAGGAQGRAGGGVKIYRLREEALAATIAESRALTEQMKLETQVAIGLRVLDLAGKLASAKLTHNLSIETALKIGVGLSELTSDVRALEALDRQ